MNKGNILSAKIIEEIDGINNAAKRAEFAWKKAHDTNDDLYFKLKGSDLFILLLQTAFAGLASKV